MGNCQIWRDPILRIIYPNSAGGGLRVGEVCPGSSQTLCQELLGRATSDLFISFPIASPWKAANDGQVSNAAEGDGGGAKFVGRVPSEKDEKESNPAVGRDHERLLCTWSHDREQTGKGGNEMRLEQVETGMQSEIKIMKATSKRSSLLKENSREMARIREDDETKALGFGVMLTRVFEYYELDVDGVTSAPTKAPFDSYTVVRSRVIENIEEYGRGVMSGNAQEGHEDVNVGGEAQAQPIPHPFYTHFQQFQQDVMRGIRSLENVNQVNYAKLRECITYHSMTERKMDRIEREQIRLGADIRELRTYMGRLRSSIDDLWQ
ncbi:hypothetical protein Dimus_006292 [Dionaea muscipula]